MNISLFYKEWIKTRHVILLSVALCIVALAYTYIVTSKDIRINGANILLSNIVLMGTEATTIMSYMPLVIGLGIALTQFIPEMVDKRLKLTLLLPITEKSIIATMLGFGTIVTGTLYIVSTIVLGVEMSGLFPSELTCRIVLTNIPYMLTGLMTYYITSWICLEPTWKQRTKNGIIAVLLIGIFMIKCKGGAATPMIPIQVIITALTASLPFYSIARFKDGAL